MTLQECIDELERDYNDKCVMLTDANLEQPGPIILWVSKAMQELTGYTLEEMCGSSPRMLRGPKSDRRVLDRLKSTLKEGEIFEGAIINYRKDKSEFCKAWRVAPIRNKDGSLTNYIAVHMEIPDLSEYAPIIEQIVAIHRKILQRLEALPD